MKNLHSLGIITLSGLFALSACTKEEKKPNVIIIYADDLGYGDISCYGATNLLTPAIDELAKHGIQFLNAHATSATCTPSRYSLLTGEYAWRKKGTGIAPGNAAMIIQPGRTTIATVFKNSGYSTAVVGKWHLGLGGAGGPDWNGEIKPGPHEINFDYSFLIPATGDRVPTVFVEDYKVVGLDTEDPIVVNYNNPVGEDPTGKDHPEMLKMLPSHGHDNTIVNGISRIGYMSGGKKARWIDEDIADIINTKATEFIERNKDNPFFLYFATHDIHVPRVPHERFSGKSGLGPRGDVILQLDNSVKEIVNTLRNLNLINNTIIIFTSDNGPVVDDGYKDRAVELLNGHKPSGPLRGGKYSAFDAGTRVPFIVYWPGNLKSGESRALISQIDLLRSFASMTGFSIPDKEAPDSKDMLDVFLGKSKKSRSHVIEQNSYNTLSIIKGDWKYIEPSEGPAYNPFVQIELGNSPIPQVYNLKEDIGERENVALENPQIVRELSLLLNKEKRKNN